MKIAGQITVSEVSGGDLTAPDLSPDARFAWGVVPELEVALRIRVRASRFDDVKALISLIEDTTT